MKSKELNYFNLNLSFLDKKASKFKKKMNQKINKANQNRIPIFQYKNRKQTILKNRDKLTNIYNSNKIFKVILKMNRIIKIKNIMLV